MSYDETTAKRVRPLLSRRKGFEEKKMFGGIGFLLNGNMCCGVWKEFLIFNTLRHRHRRRCSRPPSSRCLGAAPPRTIRSFTCQFPWPVKPSG